MCWTGCTVVYVIRLNFSISSSVSYTEYIYIRPGNHTQHSSGHKNINQWCLTWTKWSTGSATYFYAKLHLLAKGFSVLYYFLTKRGVLPPMPYLNFSYVTKSDIRDSQNREEIIHNPLNHSVSQIKKSICVPSKNPVYVLISTLCFIYQGNNSERADAWGNKEHNHSPCLLHAPNVGLPKSHQIR